MTIRFRASSAIDRMDREQAKNVTVCLMQSCHVSDVAAIESLCFAEPWSEKSLGLLLSDGAVAFVARDGERAVAYGGMLCVAGEGQITNVATHPDYRRCGLARKVLAALLQYARENDLFEVSLEVRESNEAAIALYGAYGFSICGTRRNFYKQPTENALVMVWRREENTDCV